MRPDALKIIISPEILPAYTDTDCSNWKAFGPPNFEKQRRLRKPPRLIIVYFLSWKRKVIQKRTKSSGAFAGQVWGRVLIHELPAFAHWSFRTAMGQWLLCVLISPLLTQECLYSCLPPVSTKFGCVRDKLLLHLDLILIIRPGLWADTKWDNC